MKKNDLALLSNYYKTPRLLAVLLNHLKAGKVSLKEIVLFGLPGSRPEWYVSFRKLIDDELENGWVPPVLEYPYYYNTPELMVTLVNNIKEERIPIEDIENSQLPVSHLGWYSDYKSILDDELAKGWSPQLEKYPFFYNTPQSMQMLADKIKNGHWLSLDDLRNGLGHQHGEWCDKIEKLASEEVIEVPVQTTGLLDVPESGQKRRTSWTMLTKILMALVLISFVAICVLFLNLSSAKTDRDKYALDSTNMKTRVDSLQSVQRNMEEHNKLIMAEKDSVKKELDNWLNRSEQKYKDLKKEKEKVDSIKRVYYPFYNNIIARQSVVIKNITYNKSHQEATVKCVRLINSYQSRLELQVWGKAHNKTYLEILKYGIEYLNLPSGSSNSESSLNVGLKRIINKLRKDKYNSIYIVVKEIKNNNSTIIWVSGELNII